MTRAKHDDPLIGTVGRTVLAAGVTSALLGLATFYFTSGQRADDYNYDAGKTNAAGITVVEGRVAALELKLEAAVRGAEAVRQRLNEVEEVAQRYREALAAGSRYTAELAERDFANIEKDIRRLETADEALRDIVDRNDERVTYLERRRDRATE